MALRANFWICCPQLPYHPSKNGTHSTCFCSTRGHTPIDIFETPVTVTLQKKISKTGDKFGESLGGSQAPPSFWEVPGLPRKFPELPRKFFGDFPGSSLTVELNSNPEVPRKFPKLPRKFPKLPRRSLEPLSLGSLTPSPDSQKTFFNEHDMSGGANLD